MTAQAFKIPESVLVVIYTPALDVLLIERAGQPGFWQSVTGSKDSLSEPLAQTCQREVLEETGINAQALQLPLTNWGITNVYDIYPSYLHRYASGVTRNTEHVFGLALPKQLDVQLNPREHTAYQWLPWREAADRCFSPSNAEAVLLLPQFTA
jgi:dihydroneopterin triphosphate diphosphatase